MDAVTKGQISELELHTIRSRLMAGLLNKAGGLPSVTFQRLTHPIEIA
jgi:hypothetical protein